MVTDSLALPNRAAVAPIVIAASSAAFLFVGFFKGVVPVPFDLTLAVAIIAAGSLLAVRDEIWRVVDPITAVLGALGLWLVLRYIADPNPWGMRKLAEFALMGGLAFLLGATVNSSIAARAAFLHIMAWAGVPISIVVIATAALGNPYSFSWFLVGGYQLTGTCLAISCISAAILKRPVLFGICVLGCAVTGHITGAAFGGAGVIAVWVLDRDWRAIRAQAACAAIGLAAYTALVAPPLIFMRLLWKAGSFTLIWMHLPVTPEEAADNLSLNPVGAGLLGVLRAMPTESQRYLVDYNSGDRLQQFQVAAEAIAQHPLWGSGYGALDYVDSPYPHNQLLEMAAEAGLPAAMLLAAAMACAIWVSVKRSNSLALGVCILMFLGAMVGGYFGGRHLLFAFGLAVGARYARA